MRRAWVLFIAATATLVLAPAPPALAKGPQIEHYFDSGSFVDTGLCGFPVRVSYRDEGTLYRWFDAEGNLDLFVKHSVFSETVRANGKVATGIDREKVVNAQDGSYLFTGSWIFFLPDGSHIQTAGRMETTYDGTILSEHGPHPIAEGRLAELFCPPMS